MSARPENRLAVAIGVVALIAGVVSLVTLSGTAEIVASSVLFGLSALAFVSLVFLLIGQSEEDDRHRHPHG
jgi:amino acid permease